MSEDQVNMLSRHIEYAEDSWKLNVINSYSAAYELGFNGFKQKIQEQNEVNQKACDLAFAAFALTGGTFLTVTISALLRRYVKDQAITGLLRENLNRINNKFWGQPTNDPVAFFSGGLANESSLKLGDKVVNELKSQTKVSMSAASSPFSVNLAMENVLLAQTIAMRASLEVGLGKLKTGSVTQDKWDRFVERAASSPFFHPPRFKQFSDKETTAEKIELTLYLTMMLGSDFAYRVNSGTSSRQRCRERFPIQVSPSDNSYPWGGGNKPGVPGCGATSPAVGSVIFGRIEELLTKLKAWPGGTKSKIPQSSTLTRARPTRETLKFAENVMKNVGLSSDSVFRTQSPIVKYVSGELVTQVNATRLPQFGT